MFKHLFYIYVFLVNISPGRVDARAGGESGGGADPRAVYFANTLQYVCAWMATERRLRNLVSRCQLEAKDILESLEREGRIPRVYSAPDNEVYDPNDPSRTPKDAYTDIGSRRVKLAEGRYPRENVAEKLTTSAAEMAILLGISRERYRAAGMFSESAVFKRAHVKLSSEPNPMPVAESFYACRTFCGPVLYGYEMVGARYDFGTHAKTPEDAIAIAERWCGEIAQTCGEFYQLYSGIKGGKIIPLMPEHCVYVTHSSSMADTLALSKNYLNAVFKLRQCN